MYAALAKTSYLAILKMELIGEIHALDSKFEEMNTKIEHQANKTIIVLIATAGLFFTLLKFLPPTPLTPGALDAAISPAPWVCACPDRAQIESDAARPDELDPSMLKTTDSRDFPNFGFTRS